jgi:hypothetical protein
MLWTERLLRGKSYSLKMLHVRPGLIYVLYDRYQVSSLSISCVTVYLTLSMTSSYENYVIDIKCRHYLYHVSLHTLNYL